MTYLFKSAVDLGPHKGREEESEEIPNGLGHRGRVEEQGDRALYLATSRRRPREGEKREGRVTTKGR